MYEVPDVELIELRLENNQMQVNSPVTSNSNVEIFGQEDNGDTL